MKKIICMGLFILAASLTVHAQKPDSTWVTLEYGSEHREIRELFRMQEIDFYKFSTKDIRLKEYYFLLVAKEYRGEELVRKDTLLTDQIRKELSFGKTDSVLSFSLMTQPKSKDSILFSFNLHRFGTKKRYSKEPVDTYSLRDAINSHGKPVKVPIGQSFPLWVYSLPYEDPAHPGYLFYCALTADGVPPDQWGKKYGVKHLLIIEVSILPK